MANGREGSCCGPASGAGTEAGSGSPKPPGPPEGADARAKLAWCVRDGLRAGLRMVVWLLVRMVPISLAVTLLVYVGVLQYVGDWFKPVFHLMGLPGETVIAFLAGALLNIYSCIAALGSLPLTDRQVTILAILALIAHNLPVECVIQGKAGTAGWRMLILRLVMGVLAAVALNQILPAATDAARARGGTVGTGDFWTQMTAWCMATAWLAGKVMLIVAGLMILQRLLRVFGVIDLLGRLFAPVLFLLGLPQRCAFLWIVMNTLGLAYGAAVIFEEVSNGQLDVRDAQYLNRSTAICHSLLEDTLLFVAIGASLAWVTLPRLVLAAAVVWFYRLCQRVARRT
jgi:hypothetical protein